MQDILAAKRAGPFSIDKSTKIDKAISFCVEHKLSSCLAMNKDGSVAGVFTARDFLRFMNKVGVTDHAGARTYIVFVSFPCTHTYIERDREAER